MRSAMDLDTDSNHWVHAIVLQRLDEAAFYIKVSPDTVDGAFRLQFRPSGASISLESGAVISSSNQLIGGRLATYQSYVVGDLPSY